MPEVQICRLQPHHVPRFLLLAEQEGWACDSREFAALFRIFPQGSYVALEEGAAVAFVTSVRHEQSGWIGNLLVRRDLRGKGLGRSLFIRALAGLADSGVATVWLTASEDGLRLYQSCGFRPIDTIIRWRGYGSCEQPCSLANDEASGMVTELDHEGWGDRRGLLLGTILADNPALADRDGHLVVQHTASDIQLGPWSSRDPELARSHLSAVLKPAAPATHRVILDSPSGNPHAGRLLAGAGFRRAGATVLMYRGVPPEYRPGTIYALASMGSMG